MGVIEKIDYRSKYHDLYAPSAKDVQIVVIPRLKFAMVDGVGAAEGPEQSPEFQQAIGALYGVTFTLKFSRKKNGGPDYSIMPLEGLWWMKDGEEFDMKRPADWRWTLMIMQPDFIGEDEFASAVRELKLKKQNPALDKLRLAWFDEGKAVQIMHIGPYAEESRTILRMRDFCVLHGLNMTGKHHEIYMGDPRRAKPERLKTVLRHPIKGDWR